MIGRGEKGRAFSLSPTPVSIPPILSTKPWDACGGGKKMMPVLANVEIGPRMFFPP